MFEIGIKKLAVGGDFLTGATLGKAHLDLFIPKILAGQAGNQVVVLLDFDKIKFASASYLKMAVLGLARAELRDKNGDHITVFPVIQNVSDVTVQELQIVCESESFPCLEIITFDSRDLINCRLHGKVDKTVARTLDVLQQVGRGTASNLATKCPDEEINITAWNNRLAEIFRLRLARRFKEGKFWQYQPISRRTSYGMEN